MRTVLYTVLLYCVLCTVLYFVTVVYYVIITMEKEECSTYISFTAGVSNCGLPDITKILKQSWHNLIMECLRFKKSIYKTVVLQPTV